MYDDGEKERRVKRKNVRSLKKGSGKGKGKGRALEEGDKVEARFGGKDEWFKGKITKVWRNGDAFDILYDDGDSERRVDKDLVRAVGGDDDDDDGGGEDELSDGEADKLDSAWRKGKPMVASKMAMHLQKAFGIRCSLAQTRSFMREQKLDRMGDVEFKHFKAFYMSVRPKKEKSSRGRSSSRTPGRGGRGDDDDRDGDDDEEELREGQKVEGNFEGLSLIHI